MASLYSFRESQVAQQVAQIFKSNVCVRRAQNNSIEKGVAHRFLMQGSRGRNIVGGCRLL
jgi:hypothetical protein